MVMHVLPIQFQSLQSIVADVEKHYQCQNIVLTNKLDHYFWNSIGEFNHCVHRWKRHSWECWQRHESIWHRTIRLLFRECSPPRTRSSFKRFLYCGSKVLGVVQSTKCFMLKWETAGRFSTCVVRSCLYLDTDFVDILFHFPQCYLFRRRTFFAYLLNDTGNRVFIVVQFILGLNFIFFCYCVW